MEFHYKQSAFMSSSPDNSVFDLNTCIRLVPQINDKDVDHYFVLSECVANIFKRPRHVVLATAVSVYC